jgi:hypothetical protein
MHLFKGGTWNAQESLEKANGPSENTKFSSFQVQEIQIQIIIQI